MNILLINHYAGSPQHGMEYRPYYLSKYWLRLGYSVSIIAADYSHLRYQQASHHTDEIHELIDGIQYHWVETPTYSGNGVQRVKNIWTFVRYLARNAKKISSQYKPDIVINSSTYPFDIFPAKKIAQLSNAMLIFEVHDLWPLSPMEIGDYSKWNPFILFTQFSENYCYRHANAVVSMLPCAKEHMLEHGLREEKYNHIPNGIDLEEWTRHSQEVNPDLRIKIKSLKDENFFVVGYAGGHNKSNALKYFIESKRHLKNQRVAFVLVGSGTEKSELKLLANQQSHIYFFEPIKKEAIPSLLNLFDAVYLGWHRSYLYKFGINPNKIFDYMAAGKPIVHSVNAGNDPVQSASCGLSCNAEEPSEIAALIDELSSYSQKDLDRLGENGKSFVKGNYDYKILAEQFISIIKKYL